MNNELLYIGLNGFAGSGKDTVARILKIMLGFEWSSLDEFKRYYATYYGGKVVPATFNLRKDEEDFRVYAVAFADQLKNICSSIFGIPVERFYNNKSNAWVCINKDFEYTETQPNAEYIITAEEYYNELNYYQASENRYWLSLREILVYIGTYVLQRDVNQEIFVNTVRNTIREKAIENKNLKYVIVTDIRFNHELEYIRNNNGITMTITRNDVQQLDNIAEHDLDEEDDYDYVIENNGTYDELFAYVWDLVHTNIEFENKTVELYTRDATNNYLRLIDEADNIEIYKLCTPTHIRKIQHTEGEITEIDPIGGPTIRIGEVIPGTGSRGLVPTKIALDENSQKFLIYIDKQYWTHKQ